MLTPSSGILEFGPLVPEIQKSFPSYRLAFRLLYFWRSRENPLWDSKLISDPFLSNRSQPLHPGGSNFHYLVSVCKVMRYKGQQNPCVVFICNHCVTNHPKTQWLETRVGKFWPICQIWPTVCFGRTNKLRMVFMFFRVFKKQKKNMQ